MRRRDQFRFYFKDAIQHKNVLSQLVDVIHHKLRINTSWEDYYRYRFFEGNKSWSEKSLYIGTQGSRYWPHERNSLKFDRIFQLKSIQKSIMQAGGIPTPEILVRAGLDCTVNTPEKFAREMRNVNVPFLTKNDGGAQGVGILALQPDKDGFLCNGVSVDADWIWDQYEQNIERGFFVEARVENHPVLAELHPQSLNTLRLHTLKTADGKWHTRAPFLKVGRKNSHVDNISAGGLMIALDEDGVASTAYSVKTYTHRAQHPDTGSQIEGIQVPYYQEAVELVLEASRLFGYLATIGWDVGITPTGPTIIEGNLAWGIDDTQELTGPFLTPEIAAGLAPRSWWTPWDKTHFYPDSYLDSAGGWWQRLLARRRRIWRDRLREQQRS